MPNVEIERIIDRHGRNRAGLIAMLQDIQDRYNWISEEHLRQLAEGLELPLVEIYGVASFYRALSLKPRGKHIIKICKGTSCHVRGAQLIQEEMERELGIKAGGTTEDLGYTLETVNCVGCCSMAPVVIVDEKYHADVKPHQVKKLVKKNENKRSRE
ncbi:MAG: NADH-quinone oxidoreductase subunit NuoE [Deltaproteobacteria bacterium]|nr:MAG: NADH-quinone oxidoreductase subunit NuoE [Deltaproteobacteria bacterium]